MIDLKTVSLLDILPSNLLEDPNVTAAAKAIETEMRKLTDQILQLPRYTRMDELTSEEADELAWELNIDFYDPTLPLVRRRELVKNAIPWHRRRGTASAVEEVITTIFDDAEVKEWFSYGGRPFYFKVVTREVLTPEKYDAAVKVINSVKNVRSRLETIETIRDYKQTIEISNEYVTYQYPIPFCGALICGTWPSPSTLGREVFQNIELGRGVYGTSGHSYRFAGRVITGTDEEAEQLTILVKGGFDVSQDDATVTKQYNVSGILICGNGVI